MAFQIVKGKQDAPKLLCIYGPDGTGKTRLAASAPAPLFIDLEKGSLELDVDRVSDVNSLDDLVKLLTELAGADAGPYKTLIIDSLTKIESWMMAVVKDPGYGRWGSEMAPHWRKIMTLLDQIRAKGINVIVIAHAMATKFNDPTQQIDYDKIGLRLEKVVAAMIREWVSGVYYLTREIKVVKGKDSSRGKAFDTGDRRLLYTVGRPAFDAKSRYNVPSEIEIPLNNGYQTIFKSNVDVNKELAELVKLIKSDEMRAKAQTAIDDATIDRTAILKRIKDIIDSEVPA